MKKMSLARDQAVTLFSNVFDEWIRNFFCALFSLLQSFLNVEWEIYYFIAFNDFPNIFTSILWTCFVSTIFAHWYGLNLALMSRLVTRSSNVGLAINAVAIILYQINEFFRLGLGFHVNDFPSFMLCDCLSIC